MSKLIELLSNLSLDFFPIVNNTVITDYVPIDLSIDNPDLNGVSISKIDECQAYIYKVINDTNAKVAYGGYLEKRNLYANNSKFSSNLFKPALLQAFI